MSIKPIHTHLFSLSMSLMPKRTTFRKMAKRGQVKGRGKAELVHGSMGLCASENGRITARQIEAARRTIRHKLARQGTLWIRIFPNRPVTAKPLEVRMGGGAGSVKYWSTIVKKGTVRFELDFPGYRENIALASNALSSGGTKLPIPTYLVARNYPLS